MKHKLILLATLGALSSNAFAEGEEERNWNASAELGFNFTTGNTKTSSLKSRIDATHELEKWSNSYIFDALRKKDNDDVSASKWLISAKGNYKLAEKNAFLFVVGSREEDKLGVFDNYNTVAFGYGKRFYETSTMTISADVGPGYTFFEKNNTTTGSDNSAIIRASANLTWALSETANFSQAIIINKELSDQKNTKTRLESSLSARLNGSLQMKLGLTVLNNSEVPAGSKKTDTETSVTLVYAF
jgi:putative salt-induced outer membrane protein